MKELIHSLSLSTWSDGRTDLQYGLPTIWWWWAKCSTSPSLYRATHHMKIYFFFLPTYYVIQKRNGNVNMRLGERRCRFLLLSIHQVKCVYLLPISFPPLFIMWTYVYTGSLRSPGLMYPWNWKRCANINMSTRLIINTAAVCPASNIVMEQQQQ